MSTSQLKTAPYTGNSLHVSLQTYLQGHTNTPMLRPLFHKDAVVQGLRETDLVTMSGEQFLLLATTTRNPSGKNAPKNEIRLISATETVAIAKARIHVGDVCYLDYLVWALQNDAWQIVYKHFTEACDQFRRA